MIEAAFRTLLVAHAAVAPLVVDRVYFLTRPQNERRAGVALNLVGSNPEHTMEGRGGYVTGTMRLDCLAETYKAAKELAVAVRDAIDGYAGTVAGTAIGYIEVDSQEDIEAAPLEGRAVPQFGVSVECSFLYTE